MVQVSGAMAMFVLRLAGLLSLEEAIHDHQTNLSSLDLEHNHSWPDHRPGDSWPAPPRDAPFPLPTPRTSDVALISDGEASDSDSGEGRWAGAPGAEELPRPSARVGTFPPSDAQQPTRHPQQEGEGQGGARGGEETGDGGTESGEGGAVVRSLLATMTTATTLWGPTSPAPPAHPAPHATPPPTPSQPSSAQQARVPPAPVSTTRPQPPNEGAAESPSTPGQPPGGRRLRLEVLLEDDSTAADLIDTAHLVDLQAPPEDFVNTDFAYYDFGGHNVTSSPASQSTLTAMSLVSPVPVSITRGDQQESGEMGLEDAPQPRRLPAARPIPSAYSSAEAEPESNNPYPYGPKRLPEPYVPRAPVPQPTPAPQSQEYSYEAEYYNLEEEPDTRGYEVQTRQPPVLFVFNKPGYSPEPPTTMGPPTRAPTPSDPWDCAPRCPRYTLLDWNTDYDVRQYPATLWVSTVIISDNRVLAELEGYMRVQDYFYGLNDQGLVLNLTVPFVTQVKFGRHPGVLHETNDYTVSLYVQPGYLSNLPTPISNEVLVDELEAKMVFVHSFEANVWEVTADFLHNKAEALMAQLRGNGEAFLDRYYYLASYSRPELYQRVYYEVWVYATNFRDPQTLTKPLSVARRPPANRLTQKTRNKLCRGVECPQFDVLRTYKYGIQKRRYFDALFASTSPGECHFTTLSVWKGFMPLHLYKHGINSHMEVIEATRPIALVHVVDDGSPDCPQNLTMSLYLPRRLHSNPPITGYAAPSVHITPLHEVVVYAYTVGGYLLDPARVRQELSDLKYRLTEFGACYKDDEHYVVIYDFIVRYHGRQNEIWVVAENCKATHNG